MEILTTGNIAELCGVAPRTVSKWIDSGKLKGYRIPGTLHRRVLREDLSRFLKANDMLAVTEGKTRKLFVISQNDMLISGVLKCHLDYQFESHDGKSLVALGMRVLAFEPDCVIVDLALSGSLQICSELSSLPLIAISNGQAGFDRSLVRETIASPVDFSLLRKRVDAI